MTSRLIAAFVGVALAAVAVLATLTLLASRSEVSDLVVKRNTETASSVVAELGSSYTDNGMSWSGADLRTARAVAVASGAIVEIRDQSGRVVSQPAPGQGLGSGPGVGGQLGRRQSGPVGEPHSYPILVDGARVGTAEIRFPIAEPAAERQVEDALRRTVVVGSILAGLVALAVGTLVARRVTRPLKQLTAAAGAMQRGDRAARAGITAEPAELGELGRAFDTMADTVQREDELRRNLTADVAHELRTPVTIVQGELEALLDGIADPTPERLSSLNDEVLRLGRIIDDLGTLSAADAAGLRLERAPVDLAAVAAGAAGALRPMAEAAGVTLTTTLGPARLEGDAARLDQIARNLIANAVKFTPSGGTVTVRVAAENGAVILEVADTGPGIPADELPDVFDRFWRGTAARATSGSGVGLAVVRELVTAHGGTVSGTSPPGGGARFTVELPAC
jgi:two-component system, OmpR family, sensor histidine kinase BaeS